MRYDEQQINNSLQYFEEQEELHGLGYGLARSNQMLHLKQRDGQISEWEGFKQQLSQPEKKKKFPHLRNSKQPEKRYTYFLDNGVEEEEKSFFKYEKLPQYRIQKSVQPKVSPRRINLRLPLPHIVQEANASPLFQSEVSLPLIKKIALPVKLLRKDEHQRIKKQNQTRALDLIGILGIGTSEENLARKNKMLSSTRRQIKSFQSFMEKTPRNEFDDNKLKQCITFIK